MPHSFFDALEKRVPAQREEALLAELPRQIAHAKLSSAAFADLLKDVDPAAVTSRAALARLPVIRKSELQERQQAARDARAGAVASGDVFGDSARWSMARSCRGYSPVRVRFTNPKAQGKTTGAWRARCMPQGSGRAS